MCKAADQTGAGSPADLPARGGEKEAEELFITRAVEEDLPVILQLYERGRYQMKEAGNPHQWPAGYPGEAMLREDIRQGQLWKGVAGEQIIAVFALVEGPEAEYEGISGQWLSEDPYLAIHRIVSSKGASRAIFSWAMAKTRSLRIDTHRDNAPMRHVLEREGFLAVGEITLADGSPRLAYHRIR